MGKTVEFLFDFGSPTTYLAHKRLPGVLARTGATATYVPVLLGGIFRATGNASPVTVPAKGRWMGQDMARFAARHAVPFQFNPHFPINTLQIMRGAAGLMGDPRFEAYVDAMFDAMWCKPCDLGDPEACAAVLASAGVTPDEFDALVDDPDVKQRLKEATEDAVKRGAFGAPTFFVGQDMFFGQDRLDFIEEALTG